MSVVLSANASSELILHFVESGYEIIFELEEGDD